MEEHFRAVYLAGSGGVIVDFGSKLAWTTFNLVVLVISIGFPSTSHKVLTSMVGVISLSTVSPSQSLEGASYCTESIHPSEAMYKVCWLGVVGCGADD